jgi:hypothetical protein
MQAALFNGDVLILVDNGGIHAPEEGTNFSFANHLFPIFGSEKIGGGDLVQLADFFLERHFLEEFVHALANFRFLQRHEAGAFLRGEAEWKQKKSANCY